MMIAASGCTFPISKMTSMNMRNAYARSSTDLATTVYLDNIQIDKYDQNKVALVEVVSKLKDFMDTGSIADLPLSAAKQKVEDWMITKGWGAYVSLVEVAFAYINTQHIDTDIIGQNNVTVIKQGLDQIVLAATASRKEWRSDTGSAKMVKVVHRELQIKVEEQKK
jgi:predicted transcriptional regulator